MKSDEIIEKCKEQFLKQSDIAKLYAGMIEETHTRRGISPKDMIRISEVNKTIVTRWSRSGLNRIKIMAWKIVEDKKHDLRTRYSVGIRD